MVRDFAFFLLLALFVFFTSAAFSTPLPEKMTEYLLEVDINKHKMGDVGLFLKNEKGDLYAREEDLKKWRFNIPQKPPLIHKKEAFYDLKEFKDLAYALNPKRMRLDIVSPSSYFKAQTLDVSTPAFLVPTMSAPGAYMNYDGVIEKSKHNQYVGGLFDLGVFNPYGSGSTDFVARHNTTGQNSETQFVRLNSSWQVDFPADMQTLILGDSYTVPGAWGNSVGFGGLQWGTNFQTQPAFVTFPLPSAKGVAVVPSVVDLLINGSRVAQKEVAAGPFTIDAIPATTGAGIINLVTTDLLGRQHQTSVSYYASPTLLKPGLDNYSCSIGFLRKDFGLKSHDYGPGAVSGHYQRGLTDRFTAELQGDFLHKQQAVGMGGNYLLGDVGVVNLAGAASYRSHQIGGLISVGFQRQAIDEISFGTNLQVTSASFAQTGNLTTSSPRSLWTAFIGAPLFAGASLGASYTRQENRPGPPVSFINAGYSQALPLNLSLNLSALVNVSGKREKAVFLTLTCPLNEMTSLSLGGTAEKNKNQATAQLTRNLPSGPGYGYNLRAARGEDQNYQAAVSGQNDIGTATATVAHQADVTAGQLQARGAIAFLGGRLYPSRNVGQSFAVVRVQDYENVGVYAQNQLVGKTGHGGTVLVPGLLPYQNNPIRINLQDLPLDTELKNVTMNAIPYYKTGLFLDFPVKSSTSAVLKLVLPSGEPLPAGTVVTLRKERFPVGYEGIIYLTGLEAENHVRIDYKNETYTCRIPYQKTKEPLPHLGTIRCQKK